MIFRYRLFLRWWMVGGSLKSCLTQFVPEGTLQEHFVTWGCKHSRGPTPLSKHAIFWHLDFGELTYPRNYERHYIYLFHLWGLRLLEENTRGPSLKQETPRLWDKFHITSIIHKERRLLKRCWVALFRARGIVIFVSKLSKLFSRITARKIRTTESPSSGSRTQNLTNSGSVTCEWRWRTRPSVLCVTHQMSSNKTKCTWHVGPILWT